MTSNRPFVETNWFVTARHDYAATCTQSYEDVQPDQGQNAVHVTICSRRCHRGRNAEGPSEGSRLSWSRLEADFARLKFQNCQWSLRDKLEGDPVKGCPSQGQTFQKLLLACDHSRHERSAEFCRSELVVEIDIIPHILLLSSVPRVGGPWCLRISKMP